MSRPCSWPRRSWSTLKPWSSASHRRRSSRSSRAGPSSPSSNPSASKSIPPATREPYALLRMVGRRRLSAPERRRAILDAAQDVFGERGYHGSSLDEIAQSAGISKALIYEHFESKKELHDSLLAQYAGELFERFQANAARAETGEERLRTGVAVFFGFVEEHREAWRGLFPGAAHPPPAPRIPGGPGPATGAVVAPVHEGPPPPPPAPGGARGGRG